MISITSRRTFRGLVTQLKAIRTRYDEIVHIWMDMPQEQKLEAHIHEAEELSRRGQDVSERLLRFVVEHSDDIEKVLPDDEWHTRPIDSIDIEVTVTLPPGRYRWDGEGLRRIEE